jgi:ribosomal protein S18 acetylase RimI-like enzyme
VSTPIEVRRARAEEYACVAELTSTTYLREGWGDAGYEPVLRDVAGRAGQATVLVALSAGRLVGTVTVATRGGRYAELAAPGEAVVRMLVTDPAARGRGVGEALMQAALRAASDEGCTAVRLSTQPGMVAAHRLYERLGFVRTPADDWRPRPDLLLLTYRLDLAVRPPGRDGAARR